MKIIETKKYAQVMTEPAVPQQMGGAVTPQQQQMGAFQTMPGQQPQEQVDPQQEQNDINRLKAKVFPMIKKLRANVLELSNNWRSFENEQQIEMALGSLQESLQLVIGSVQAGRRKTNITTQQAIQQARNPIGEELQ